MISPKENETIVLGNNTICAAPKTPIPNCEIQRDDYGKSIGHLSRLDTYDYITCQRTGLPNNLQDCFDSFDFLESIFKEQAELNLRLVGRDPSTYTEDEVQQWIQKYSLALQQEVSELIDTTQWKWWKTTKFNMQNAKVEMVDILHFLVSLFQLVGMDAKDVWRIYMEKNKVNHKRQDFGYSTHLEDCKHIE